MIRTMTLITTAIALVLAGNLALAGEPAAPKLENLLTSPLAGVDTREVIVSRVSIPANTRLPVHWHPGEEFAYIIEGSVTLWQQGKKDIHGKKGDVIKVPFKQVHTAETSDEAAVILVVRIHEPGQPGRVLVQK